jgi:hypothetical protein
MPLFAWTGNPWVDTGLAVMIARARELGLSVKTIDDLTPGIIEHVCSSKSSPAGKEYSWLTDMNRRLNCYTMIFSSNGPLTNTSTNPQKTLADLERKIEISNQEIENIKNELIDAREKLSAAVTVKQKSKSEASIGGLQTKLEKANSRLAGYEIKRKDKLEKKTASDSDDKGLEDYISILKALVEDLKIATPAKDICEVTGLSNATLVLESHGKQIGKEWFPLVGTLSDVQTLPSGSRAMRLSALALLAAQCMPMGMAMLAGKLVCFQTSDFTINDVPLFQSMVEEIYTWTMEKANLTNLTDKVATWGKEARYNSITFLLLGRLTDLMQRKRLTELPDYVCLNLWRFSNSGQDPHLELIPIPNEAIRFLWEAWRGPLRHEIEMYLRADQNTGKKESQLLESIKDNKEYYGFYPDDDRQPASIDLFDLYVTSVLGMTVVQLETAKWIAGRISKLAKAKHLDHLKQTLKDDYREMREIIIQLADEELTLEDYVTLFPCTTHPLRPDGIRHSRTRRIIWFYLNHELTGMEKPIPGGDIELAAHVKYPKIKSFAQDFFQHYMEREGKERFQKRILTAFKQDQVKPHTVENWFATLGETKDGYTNEEWDDLCRDENGNTDIWEVMFQLRLELVNLYRSKYGSIQ